VLCIVVNVISVILLSLLSAHHFHLQHNTAVKRICVVLPPLRQKASHTLDLAAGAAVRERT
jgi:hypothetical protein